MKEARTARRRSRSATAIEDMFSACGKSRSDSADAERIPDHKGRQGRQGRVEIPGLRGWQSSGNFDHTGSVRTPETDPCSSPRHGSRRVGRPVAGGRRVLQGGPHLRRRRGFQLPSRSGRPVRDITGRARGRHQWPAVFLSLDWENLSGAERNLRVRLSETRDRDARASRLRRNVTPGPVQPSNQGRSRVLRQARWAMRTPAAWAASFRRPESRQTFSGAECGLVRRHYLHGAATCFWCAAAHRW